MNVILERKAPYIKPYKGYNQYNNRRLQYIIISNDTPIINVYFRSTALYHSKRGNVQEGKYNAYMEEMTTREKNAQKRTKYHGFLTKTENRTIYYYR